MKLSVVLNVLLFIRSIKSRFAGDSDITTYSECESYLEGLLEKETGDKNAAPAVPGEHDGMTPDLRAISENAERALQIAIDNNSMMQRLVEILDKPAQDVPSVPDVPEETQVTEAGMDWFLGISADTWFNLSQIAEENSLVNDRGKAMLYNMGRYRLNNWTPTEKQLSYAKLLRKTVEGFLSRSVESAEKES
jgi:hypothetical protein